MTVHAFSPLPVSQLALAVEAVRRDPGPVVIQGLEPLPQALAAGFDRAALGDAAGARATFDAAVVGLPLGDDGAIALGAIRDHLLGLSLLKDGSPAARERLLALGERFAATVLAEALRRGGIDAIAEDPDGMLVLDARGVADDAKTALRVAQWRPRGAVPVLPGGLASGRTVAPGGAVWTATRIARGRGAARVVSWAGRAGVMTADPAIVPEALPLVALSYGEALELAEFDGRLLHPRALLPLIDAGIALEVRDLASPDQPGTRIDARGADDEGRATAVASLEDQALVDLQLARVDHGGRLAERFDRALAAATDAVWLATHAAHGQSLAAVVPAERTAAVRASLEAEFAPELARGDVRPLGVRAPVSLITLVAEAMGRTPNVAGRMFGAIGGVGVNVLAIGQSASSRSISCVVDGADTALVVNTVHAAFNLRHARVSLFVLGAGLVGGHLLDQIAAQAKAIEAEQDVRIVVVGIATSQRFRFEPGGIDLGAWRAALAAGDEGAVTDELLDRLQKLPAPILIDCTSADSMERTYARALQRGVHVVAANKKPLATPQPTRDALLAQARRAHRAYRYETTVGAALPVIQTLQDLVNTGDAVVRVEGSFSGTLGFVCDEISKGRGIDEVVREARARGFTEPHPRDDLAGVDAARKALILAREIGLRLDLSDVEITPMVRKELLEIDDVETFLHALADERAPMAAFIEEARAQGRVVRYLAVIDPAATPILKVGPVTVPPEHPAHRLRGATAQVAFTTRRYPHDPLVVQGAGAGGEVTAGGVLADILRIASSLRSG